jgi:hypothetical protein
LECDVRNWIPFEEGEYLIEKALLVSPQDKAVEVENAAIEIYQDRTGTRQLRGKGRIRNILMVELLEDTDDIDLILDLGDEFKYRLKLPEIKTGKVFAPDIKSAIHFRPTSPWEEIPQTDFTNLISGLHLLSL